MPASEETLTVTIPPAVKHAAYSPTSSSYGSEFSDDTLGDPNEKAFQQKIISLEQRIEDLEAQLYNRPKRFAWIRYFILDVYRRLFSLVFLANVGIFIAIMITDRKLLALVNATAANLMACGLARQPLVVNSIFKAVCSIPRTAPLRLRLLAAKAHHYGGVHSGCGIASLVWYTGFVGMMSREFWSSGQTSPITMPAVVLSYIIIALLLAIIMVAFPTFRVRKHDYFELIHRFSGWLVVALFVALLFVFCDDFSKVSHQPLGIFLVKLPAFWFLVITVMAIVHPWLLLRKVPVEPEYLSSHAIRLHFSHTSTSFGKGIQVSTYPLRDWHAFATFPDIDGKGFSSVVSKAGDWTSACIANPPTHLWKRGVLIHGFAYVMRVFQRIIVVTTGSGMGPCLSFLGDENRPDIRVVWQTRSPLKTYGQGVLDMVAILDPNAIVIDTDRSARIDMVPIIRRLVKEHRAEAVCVVSNPVVTTRVVYELEKTGTPAFGPIFDS